ncbi:MAG TPA: DUF4173 domain-containing protein [Gemmatimonadaceae bacterium]|nr:DUF4173 domain-containing protein [Gemmatimonadaceae bacterium]
MLWIAALLVTAFGDWVLFDAQPGLNWALWTALASVGLIVIARARGRLDRSVLVMLGTATIGAIGAAITATEYLLALTCLGVMLFLAMAMLLAGDPGLKRISPIFVVTAPFIAGFNALIQSFARAGDLTRVFRSERSRATVRGIVITVPILVVFALLLSSADPTFASWREAVERIIENWSFLPRTIFFLVLLVIVLGAYSFVANTSSNIPTDSYEGVTNEGRWFGATERLILLSGVTALLWLFILVQLTYLFGNAPSVRGSGWSFAEYAKRGFGEITVVATLSGILILLTEKFGRLDANARSIKGLTGALLVAVLILLVSAFRRVVLYEDAYGFTVARLYAQVYMIVLAVALGWLAVGVYTNLDINALFRRVFATAVLAFLVLVFWNHEAWIASKNIARFAGTPRMDIKYLVNELSLNAVPTLVARIHDLPQPQRTELETQLTARYSKRRHIFDNRWFEWNYRREQARRALYED